jgi:hypothetical protein
LTTETKNQRQLNSDFVVAAHEGNLPALVQAKLDGADVNAVDEQSGLQALHLAIVANNLLMMRYLMEQCGVEPLPDRSGRWPTLIAAQCAVAGEVGDYICEREKDYLTRTGQFVR